MVNSYVQLSVVKASNLCYRQYAVEREKHVFEISREFRGENASFVRVIARQSWTGSNITISCMRRATHYCVVTDLHNLHVVMFIHDFLEILNRTLQNF